MPATVCFPPLEPKRPKTRIWPVFLPFQGCPGKCIYCAQDLQTGTAQESLPASYAQLKAGLLQAAENNMVPCELGFFGGTFTALPSPWPEKFLSLARTYQKSGLITRIRCSTRPDGLDLDQLCGLKKYGLDLVELGVQSFSDQALLQSQRAYTQAEATRGCRLVHSSGLELGIQLLPGLPGHDQRAWLDDIQATIGLRPALVRIYPCLILKNTPLERLWRSGLYCPWSLEQTVAALSRGVFRLWRAGVPVTRIGLPQEAGLIRNLVAGPWHPALGSLVKSRILLASLVLPSLALGAGAKTITCPKRFQGEIFGYKGEYRTRLKNLGLRPTDVLFQNQDRFELRKKTPRPPTEIHRPRVSFFTDNPD